MNCVALLITAAINRSYLGTQQYRLWQRQGRAAAADVKKATELARKEVMDLQNRYWTILDGKWDHIVRFQKIVLDFGGLTRSWNGPETTIKN